MRTKRQVTVMSIRFPVELREALRSHAYKLGISINALVIHAAEKYLERAEDDAAALREKQRASIYI